MAEDNDGEPRYLYLPGPRRGLVLAAGSADDEGADGHRGDPRCDVAVGCRLHQSAAAWGVTGWTTRTANWSAASRCESCTCASTPTRLAATAPRGWPGSLRREGLRTVIVGLPGGQGHQRRGTRGRRRCGRGGCCGPLTRASRSGRASRFPRAPRLRGDGGRLQAEPRWATSNEVKGIVRSPTTAALRSGERRPGHASISTRWICTTPSRDRTGYARVLRSSAWTWRWSSKTCGASWSTPRRRPQRDGGGVSDDPADEPRRGGRCARLPEAPRSARPGGGGPGGGGYAGEDTNKLLGLPRVVSRKLDDPLSVLIQSRSAAGKSSCGRAVRAGAARGSARYTRVTGQALYYLEEDGLSHKVLSIEEAAGRRGRRRTDRGCSRRRRSGGGNDRIHKRGG